MATALGGRVILIVEDEPLIALDIRAAFESAGAIVATASSVETARPLIDERLSAAILDIKLSDGECEELCRRLHERGIPFVIHSGKHRISDVCRHGIPVPKPARADALVKAVLGMLDGKVEP
jgi:DNA-binding response OmpR family regulator